MAAVWRFGLIGLSLDSFWSLFGLIGLIGLIGLFGLFGLICPVRTLWFLLLYEID